MNRIEPDNILYEIAQEDKNAVKTTEFLTKSKIIEAFANNDVLEIIRNLSFEEFLGFIKRINWLVRWQKIKERWLYYDLVGISNLCLHELWTIDKEKSLKLLFENLAKINDIEKIAKLFYLWLLIIHPFGDWNWRTARTIFTLIMWWNLDKENLEKDINLMSMWWKIWRRRMERYVQIGDTIWELRKQVLSELLWIDVSWVKGIKFIWINEDFIDKLGELNKNEKLLCESLLGIETSLSIFSQWVIKFLTQEPSIILNTEIRNWIIVINIDQDQITKENLSKIIDTIKEVQLIYLSKAIEYITSA